MNLPRTYCLFLAVLMARSALSATTSETAASDLIERILPQHARQFILELIPPENGQDVFELQSRDGKVVVRGNSPLSQAVAVNWYLKYYGRGHVSLNGRQLHLPPELPALKEKVRQVAWARSRYFLNYCTFGYSMPWWDWAQWERFIDWMALNGVNQPLAVTGQEAVWQAVGRRFGMTEPELEAFLPGPPYLPFGWMGCLDSYGGPLPKDWVARHAELQKKILARERALGMTPVLQGFTGRVPQALAKRFPEAKTQRIHWAEFDTCMLDPQDQLFQKIGTAFIEEQTKLFGSDHCYAADSFIEMAPPSGDQTYLAGIGRAIYRGMAQADPQAVWLLQGWTFMNQHEFWTPERIRAFLGAIPDDRLLVLDLFCDSHPVWSETEGFYGKPWVWNFLCNFGNTTFLGSAGPLSKFHDLAAARRSPLGRNLRGVGLMMEGYGHNPILFELMFEMAWRNDVELNSWVREFARFRYGKENAEAQAAWKTLADSVYSHGAGGQTVVTSFPSDTCRYTRYPEAALANTWRGLLEAAPELGESETYRHDLVNVARQTLSHRAGNLYAAAMAARQAKDSAAYRQASGEFLRLIRELDELLASNDGFLLGRWLEEAKRWGATDAERARLQWNARRILTLWDSGTDLRDYAWKEWSGLLTGFYAKRWEIFFQRSQEALEAGKPFDQTACQAEIYRFENDWCGSAQTYPTEPIGDSIAIARRLYEQYRPRPTVHLALGKPVTCSLALPGMDASLANDGLLDTESYWATDLTQDKAAWWQVDLEKPTTVGRVVVVGYYGDKRYYGFFIEGSLDGKSWNRLADCRDNTAPSTSAGYTCRFPPVPIRYLRVTMTGNSANSGRHLVEVMAYDEPQ